MQSQWACLRVRISGQYCSSVVPRSFEGKLALSTAFSHGLVGAALASAGREAIPVWRLFAVLVLASMAPDLDVVGYLLGVPYDHMFGHRGFTHSILFAFLLGFGAGTACFPELKFLSLNWWWVCGLIFLSCGSHGVIDATTNAGLGIGFFVPFSGERYFFPWRPILTPPVSPFEFFDAYGMKVLRSEFRYIWVPACICLVVTTGVRLVFRQGNRMGT